MFYVSFARWFLYFGCEVWGGFGFRVISAGRGEGIWFGGRGLGVRVGVRVD